MDKEYSIDIIIPTYKPDHTFENLITKLSKQSIKINNIWVINTDKKFFDENKYSKFKNLYIQHIDKKDFDHGGTRNLAAKNSNADILVFMTQDAVPANVNFLEELIKPFSDPLVSAAYGRQVPRKEAKPIEFFTRQFNYPNTDIIKSKNDIERLGIKTFFCTNVCSAFRTEDFWKYGGFPEKTILNEDMIMASKIILDGKKVVYASKAEVIHSHSYTYWQQFTRNFDIAVSLRQNEEILKYVKSESEGIKLVKETAKYLIKINKPYLIFDLILESGFKFLGYKLGMLYDKLPIWLVKKFSMHKSYWN